MRLIQRGNEFLIYAKEAVSQYELIEDRFIDRDKNKKHFSVSMQHYVFAVHAFVRTVKNFDTSKYVYSVYETRTDEVLNNVKNLKSLKNTHVYPLTKVVRVIFICLRKH